MDELTGKEIWVVEYNNIELCDCNGVFSTFEKAVSSVLEDAERCNNIWTNFHLSCDDFDNEFFCYSFNCKDLGECQAWIYKSCIK